MIVTRSLKDQNWTDLNSPTQEEVDSLVLSQNIDPFIAHDLLTPTPKQYAAIADGSIYVVLHIPSFKHSHTLESEQEIDCIITDKGLITARYDSIDALHQFAKQIEVSEILNNKHPHHHLFFGMMHEIYQFLFNEIDYIKDWMKEIEKNIFSGFEKEMVMSISAASRNLLCFKRTVDPHQNVFEHLQEMGDEIFGKKFVTEAHLLSEEWERLNLEIENLSKMLDELRETNNSILTTKQNEIMKTFTILAFVTFPLSVIAAIFGMSTSYIPLKNDPIGFWLVLAIMLGTSLAMFAYFKYKRWI